MYYKTKESKNNLLIMHLPYHSNNPTKSKMRTLTDTFKSELLKGDLQVDRMITALLKGPSISDFCKRHRLEGFINIHPITWGIDA